MAAAGVICVLVGFCGCYRRLRRRCPRANIVALIPKEEVVQDADGNLGLGRRLSKVRPLDSDFMPVLPGIADSNEGTSLPGPRHTPSPPPKCDTGSNGSRSAAGSKEFCDGPLDATNSVEAADVTQDTPDINVPDISDTLKSLLPPTHSPTTLGEILPIGEEELKSGEFVSTDFAHYISNRPSSGRPSSGMQTRTTTAMSLTPRGSSPEYESGSDSREEEELPSRVASSKKSATKSVRLECGSGGLAIMCNSKSASRTSTKEAASRSSSKVNFVSEADSKLGVRPGSAMSRIRDCEGDGDHEADGGRLRSPSSRDPEDDGIAAYDKGPEIFDLTVLSATSRADSRKKTQQGLPVPAQEAGEGDVLLDPKPKRKKRRKTKKLTSSGVDCGEQADDAPPAAHVAICEAAAEGAPKAVDGLARLRTGPTPSESGLLRRPPESSPSGSLEVPERPCSARPSSAMRLQVPSVRGATLAPLAVMAKSSQFSGQRSSSKRRSKQEPTDGATKSDSASLTSLHDLTPLTASSSASTAETRTLDGPPNTSSATKGGDFRPPSLPRPPAAPATASEVEAGAPDESQKSERFSRPVAGKLAPLRPTTVSQASEAVSELTPWPPCGSWDSATSVAAPLPPTRDESDDLV